MISAFKALPVALLISPLWAGPEETQLRVPTAPPVPSPELTVRVEHKKLKDAYPVKVCISRIQVYINGEPHVTITPNFDYCLHEKL